MFGISIERNLATIKTVEDEYFWGKLLIVLLMLLTSIFYISIRATHFQEIPITFTNDSDSYIFMAGISLFEGQFWTGIRPFTYPLLIKLGMGNWGIFTQFQFMLSLISWLCLAYVVSARLSFCPLRIFSFGFILLFSLSTDVILWDRLIQTESVNISIFVLLLSLGLIKIGKPSKALDFFIPALLTLWAFLRDTNALLLLIIALLTVGYLFFTKAQ